MVADVFAAVHEKNEQMDTSPVQTEWLAAHWAGVSVVYRAIAEDQRLAIPIYVSGDQLLTSGDETDKKSMIAVLVLIGLVVYGGYDYFHKSSSETGQIAESGEANLETGILRGQFAPEFSLTDLPGNPVRLSDFKGKKVLVNFWATWCPPCRVEMPHMQKFYEDYQSKDVVILGVNLTPTEENPDNVKHFERATAHVPHRSGQGRRRHANLSGCRLSHDILARLGRSDSGKVSGRD